MNKVNSVLQILGIPPTPGGLAHTVRVHDYVPSPQEGTNLYFLPRVHQPVLWVYLGSLTTPSCPLEPSAVLGLGFILEELQVAFQVLLCSAESVWLRGFRETRGSSVF